MKALIIATIGTPIDASDEAIRKYLQNYLGDGHVISMPQPFRRRLVENKIIPHHLHKSVARYRALQSLYKGEMPLRKYTLQLEEKMKACYSKEWAIYTLQLFGEGNEEELLLKEIATRHDLNELTIVPLYPQQTISSYNSVVDKIVKVVKRYLSYLPTYVVRPFFQYPLYIDFLAKQVNTFVARETYDLLLCSFHSIPLVHQQWGKLCGYNYRKQCEQTSRLLFESLSAIESLPYRVAFQSAMGKKWLTPITEILLPSLPKEGIKKVLVLCPGFLIDCLETVLDLDCTLKSQFLDAGGEKLDIIPSFNASEEAVTLIYSLATNPKMRRRVQ